MTSNSTRSAPDTHKHPSAASRESSCSRPLRRRRRADCSPNYTPSPNYPIIKTLAVSHHINWVPPLCQFVWSQSATGVSFWFIFCRPVWAHTLQRPSELLKRRNGLQSLMPCRKKTGNSVFRFQKRSFFLHPPVNVPTILRFQLLFNNTFMFKLKIPFQEP